MLQSRNIDYPLLFAVLSLVIFWSIMISSVSVYDSYRITKRLVEVGSLEEPNNWRFLLRNVLQAGMGLCAMVIAIKIPYIYWKKHANVFAAVVIVMLLLVLVLWVKINGARGWFDIPWLPFSLQPTEFLKLSIIVSVSSFCTKYRHFLPSIRDGFIPFIWLLWIPALLVALQPDLGALLIIVPVALSIYFIAWWNIRVLIAAWIIWFFLTFTLYVLGNYDSGWEKNKFSYIHDRINTFFQSNKNAIQENTMHHQNKQALIAIGSGWLTGLWFGDSIQKYWYLPEPQWDFIFSIITEELGFFGATVIILIYLYIIYRGMLIAFLCENIFGKFVAFGISFWILWQVIVNISVNLSIFPNTGLTLPFVSYGWSSLLMMLTAVGILLSISRDIDHLKKHTKNTFFISFLKRARR